MSNLLLRNAAQMVQRQLGRSFELMTVRAVSIDSTLAGSSGSSEGGMSTTIPRPPGGRWYANANSSTNSNSNNNNNNNNNSDDDVHDHHEDDERFMSPFDSLFHMINEGKTSMGTTHLQRSVPRYLKCGVPEDALRFRTRHYGRLFEAPFIQSNEHKVTLTVAPHSLPLNEVERKILQQIVGQRLNQDRLQLSSAQFGSRIENKRHLISILDRVVLEAKKIAQQMNEDHAGGVVVNDDVADQKHKGNE